MENDYKTNVPHKKDDFDTKEAEKKMVLIIKDINMNLISKLIFIRSIIKSVLLIK